MANASSLHLAVILRPSTHDGCTSEVQIDWRPELPSHRILDDKLRFDPTLPSALLEVIWNWIVSLRKKIPPECFARRQPSVLITPMIEYFLAGHLHIHAVDGVMFGGRVQTFRVHQRVEIRFVPRQLNVVVCNHDCCLRRIICYCYLNRIRGSSSRGRFNPI